MQSFAHSLVGAFSRLQFSMACHEGITWNVEMCALGSMEGRCWRKALQSISSATACAFRCSSSPLPTTKWGANAASATDRECDWVCATNGGGGGGEG